MSPRAARNGSRHRGAAALICLASLGLAGCAATMQEAAKSAAPAAVEGAVDEAQKPDTRDDIARILADPDIRAAASSLTASIVAGAFNGLSDEARVKELRRLTDTIVQSMGVSVSRSLRDQIGPQLSETLAEAVDRSIERALDTDTEHRVEALTLAATRGVLTGVRETLLDPNGQPSPVWGQLLGRIARDATHEAAFGVDDAVRRARQNDGDAPPAPVLAALGTLSSLTQALPFLIAGSLLGLLLLCLLPVVWLVLRVRHLEREGRAREEEARALDRAIKSTEPMPWSNELREHLARETRHPAPGPGH